jgi:nucleoside-diphosphate-sugar epimerase
VDALHEAAKNVDAVIHAAFDRDTAFSGGPQGPVLACGTDRNAITALGDGLAQSGSNKTLIYTSGTLNLTGEDETASPHPNPRFPRGLSDVLVRDYAQKGVRSITVRLPPLVHSPGVVHPFIGQQIEAARKSGFAGYVGDGTNLWQAAHIDDVADLIVLALTRGESGTALHAVKEEGIPLKDISTLIGKKMGLQTKSVNATDAVNHFGFVGIAMLMGKRVTADKTKQVTGWQPKGSNLFDTMETYTY